MVCQDMVHFILFSFKLQIFLYFPFSQWSQWSTCSVSCAKGTVFRTRDCHQRKCIGKVVDLKECTLAPCPEFRDWSPWSPCSSTCGQGKATRTRTCPGLKCSGVDTEFKLCFRDRCPPKMNNVLKAANAATEEESGGDSSWGSWSTCSRTCGEGFRTRKLRCKAGGCKDEKDLVQVRSCKSDECSGLTPGSKEDCLLDQNGFRVRHGSPALEWDEQLASKASDVAQYIAAKDLTEKQVEKYETTGTSIAILPHEPNESANQMCGEAARKWYEEEKFYDFKNPRLSEQNRHFTQLVWKASKRVGVGKSISNDGKSVYVVAIYYPPGNSDNYNDFRRNTLITDFLPTEEIYSEDGHHNLSSERRHRF